MTNQTKEELKKAFREVADRANNFTTYVTMSGSYVLNPEPIADYFIDQFDNIINESCCKSCQDKLLLEDANNNSNKRDN